MGRPVVFVDTNCIDNKSSATAFLGNRNDIEKIAKRAKIILPRVVYDELVIHVRLFLLAQLKALKKNPHRYHLNIEDKHIEALDIDQLIVDLKSKESITFEVLELSNKLAAYEAIYLHSINGTPPFEPNGDKGFKDAVIAKTVDEYVGRDTDESILLFTKDERLAEYFEDSEKVTVIKSYEDFDREYTLDRLDDYMIARIQDFLNEATGKPVKVSLKDHWLNWDGELIGEFVGQNGKYVVRVDTSSREPIDYIEEDIETNLSLLEETANFKGAHDNMSVLDGALHFLSEEHSKRAYMALVQNDQIYSIGQDIDIKQVVDNFTNLLEGFSLKSQLKAIRERYRLESKQQDADKKSDDELDALASYVAELQSDIERGH